MAKIICFSSNIITINNPNLPNYLYKKNVLLYNIVNNIDKKKTNETINLRNNLYNSYDFLLYEKYKIEVNENTLDRMKNYFR